MTDREDRAQTWGRLAKQLQVSTNAIREWRKLPGSPETPEYEPWKAFVAENQLGIAGNRVTPQREALLVESVQKKNRLLDLEIARKEGSSVDRSAVDALLVAVFTRQRAVLYAALEGEYPGKAVGRTASEIRVLGGQLAGRICDVFSRDVEKWEWPSD